MALLNSKIYCLLKGFSPSFYCLSSSFIIKIFVSFTNNCSLSANPSMPIFLKNLRSCVKKKCLDPRSLFSSLYFPTPSSFSQFFSMFEHFLKQMWSYRRVFESSVSVNDVMLSSKVGYSSIEEATTTPPGAGAGEYEYVIVDKWDSSDWLAESSSSEEWQHSPWLLLIPPLSTFCS